MTRNEFNNLRRNDLGDIIDLYDVFYRLTDAQVNKLTSDDWSRYHEYFEEVLAEYYALDHIEW